MNINKDILVSALSKWGSDAQIDMTIEECAELIVELAHARRGREGYLEKAVEEIADVIIMSHQMAILFGEDHVQKVIDQKLERLTKRILEDRFEASPGE
jgi:NTP pyrophosphatase (non-canonical NTP hydrolase)